MALNSHLNRLDGKIALYDTNTGDIKVKTFVAHQGEVLCITPGPGNAYVITGGVDFNARSWQLNGNAIVASKYHHGAVECVLVTPLTAPPPSSRPASAKPGAGAGAGDAGGAGTGGKIWTGSADGTVFCWPDPEGKGQINEAEGKSIKVEGGKVKSMAHSGDCVWVGMDDGRINVLHLSDGSLVKSLKGTHSGPVLTLAKVADQGGYVKGLLTIGWCVWAFNSASTKVYTAESIWHAEAARAEGALKALEDTRADMESQLAKAREEANKAAMEAAAARAAAEKASQDGDERVKELQAKVDELQSKLDAANAELEDVKRRLEEAEAALVAAKEGATKAGDSAAAELSEAL
eukprot:XP_001699942.1 predicted protein [Chlamydomonas reinhardtii]